MMYHLSTNPSIHPSIHLIESESLRWYSIFLPARVSYPILPFISHPSLSNIHTTIKQGTQPHTQTIVQNSTLISLWQSEHERGLVQHSAVPYSATFLMPTCPTQQSSTYTYVISHHAMPVQPHMSVCAVETKREREREREECRQRSPSSKLYLPCD